MDTKENANTGIVGHSVGNKPGSTRGRYVFAREQNYSAEETIRYVDAENARTEAIEQLEGLIRGKGEGSPDQAMSDFLERLKSSDWSTEESFLTFKRDVFDPFVGLRSAQERRDEIFKRPLK